MKKIIIILPVILALTFILGCKKEIEKGAEDLTGITAIEEGEEAEEDLVIAKCKELFQQKQSEGADFSQGPCLSNEIIPGWVCDVAHSPREAVDNKPENQCSAYREGRAEHFVELGINGELIKTR